MHVHFSMLLMSLVHGCRTLISVLMAYVSLIILVLLMIIRLHC